MGPERVFRGQQCYLGDWSSRGHLRALKSRSRAWFGSERCHRLANTIRQYEVFPQLNICSSLGYSVLRARSQLGRRYRMPRMIGGAKYFVYRTETDKEGQKFREHDNYKKRPRSKKKNVTYLTVSDNRQRKNIWS